MPRPTHNLLGQRFERLTVIAKSESAAHGATRWRCLCECGKEHTALAINLLRGLTRSCGCLKAEIIKAGANFRHGQAIGIGTPEYRTWGKIRERCFVPDCKEFKNYGGRGITVCDRWLDFENFLADMGFRPAGDYSIERINNNGNYEPGNCRWATRLEQMRNKRNNHQLTVSGSTMCLSEWQEVTGIKAPTIRRRLKRGWSAVEAVSISVYLLLAIFLSAQKSACQAVPYSFMPPPRIQFTDPNGTPLNGGFLFSYAAGTSTPLATYHLDTLGSITANTNPIVLDPYGSAEIRLLPQAYKFVLQDLNHNQIWQIDQVEDVGQILYTQAVLLNPAGAALQTIVGPLAASYFVGTTAHFTSPGVRVSILDPNSVLDTASNPPNLVSAAPAIAGQTDAIPDGGALNSTFVLSPGPPNWTANTAYVLNNVILPYTTNPCDFTFIVTTAGTSGGSNPVFSTTPCGSSPTTVADGTVVWTNQGAFQNTNVLDCTKAGLTCKRTAFIYFEGAGCNNTTAAMGFDTFGTNSPSPLCVTGVNVQKGVLGLPSAATLLQESTNPAASASTNVVSYPKATTAGDLLEVDCVVDTSRTVSTVTDGTNAYSKAKSVANGATDLEIWYFNGNSTSMPAATNLTVTFSGSGNSICDWKEYAGIVTASMLDVTASNTGTGTVVTSGTTAGTAQNTELVLAAVGSPGGVTVAGQAGFVRHTASSQSTNVTLSSEGIIQQATAAQSGNFTLGASQAWAAAVVTFKANVGAASVAQRSVVLPQYFLASAPVFANVKWQAPYLPVGNGTIPTVSLTSAVGCTADGSTDDNAFNTGLTLTPLVPASSANTLTTSSFNPLMSTGCAAGSMLHYQIQRNRYSVADVYEGFVEVNGIALQFGVTQ